MENFITLNPYLPYSQSPLAKGFTVKTYSELTQNIISLIKHQSHYQVVVYPVDPGKSLLKLIVNDKYIVDYLGGEEINIYNAQTGENIELTLTEKEMAEFFLNNINK